MKFWTKHEQTAAVHPAVHEMTEQVSQIQIAQVSAGSCQEVAIDQQPAPLPPAETTTLAAKQAPVSPVQVHPYKLVNHDSGFLSPTESPESLRKSQTEGDPATTTTTTVAVVGNAGHTPISITVTSHSPDTIKLKKKRWGFLPTASRASPVVEAHRSLYAAVPTFEPLDEKITPPSPALPEIFPVARFGAIGSPNPRKTNPLSQETIHGPVRNAASSSKPIGCPLDVIREDAEEEELPTSMAGQDRYASIDDDAAVVETSPAFRVPVFSPFIVQPAAPQSSTSAPEVQPCSVPVKSVQIQQETSIVVAPPPPPSTELAPVSPALNSANSSSKSGRRFKLFGNGSSSKHRSNEHVEAPSSPNVNSTSSKTLSSLFGFRRSSAPAANPSSLPSHVAPLQDGIKRGSMSNLGEVPSSPLSRVLPRSWKRNHGARKEDPDVVAQQCIPPHLRNVPPVRKSEEQHTAQRHKDIEGVIRGTMPLPVEMMKKYELVDLLGNGAFGFVFSAKIRNAEGTIGKEWAAIKFIVRERVQRNGYALDEKYGYIPFECHFVRKMNHPNIIRFLDLYADEKFFFMITELHGTEWRHDNPLLSPETNPRLRVPKGDFEKVPYIPIDYTSMTIDQILDVKHTARDLFACIDAHRRLDEGAGKKIFAQIVDAVEYLQKRGFVHRDLKDENIVIDENYVIKMVDFGSVGRIPPAGETSQYFDRFYGTIHFASPEILQGNVYRGPEAEVWALGVLLYTIMFGQSPFATTDDILKLRLRYPVFAQESGYVALLQEIFNSNPDTRITLDQVKRHSWLQGAMEWTPDDTVLQ